MKRIALALSTSIIIITAGNGTVAAERKLTGAEITSMFTNATVYWKWDRWDAITIFKAGGAMQGTIGNRSDTGRWWVSGEKYCRQWNQWNNAKKRCATIGIDGDKAVYHFDDGQVATTTAPKK